MNTKELTKIQINFKNTAAAEIEVENIKKLKIEKIDKSYQFENSNYEENAGYQQIYLILSSTIANRRYEELGAKSGEGLFDRLKYNRDITSITLYFGDNTKAEVQAPWKSIDKEDTGNEYQLYFTDYTGDLKISIAPNQLIPSITI